jgi:Family of unknown function (DUF6090)
MNRGISNTFAQNICRTMSKPAISPQVVSKLLSYDYKSAVEKIGFTVLGILIALWINRCDENWKKNALEEKSLRELHAALAVDLVDIQKATQGDTVNVWHIQKALQFMRGEPVNMDSLPYHFKYSFFYSFLLANTSAYETLKSRGLDLITNDSLRLAIAHLYDVSYDFQTKVDDINNTLYNNHISPLRVKYFAKDPASRLPYDLNYDELRRDRDLYNALKISLEMHYKNRNEYEYLEAEVLALQAMIQRELK